MEKAEACDERFEEVGWGHTTCEGGEQGSASLCGVAGGKGLNQGESGLPKHVPNPVSGKRATGGGPDTESCCRQSPEVGAGWFNDHVRICAGGAQQCAFLPQLRGVRRNPYSYRNREPRVGNHPRPPGCECIGGGGGNRTRVREHSAFGSTCLAASFCLTVSPPDGQGCETASLQGSNDYRVRRSKPRSCVSRPPESARTST